MVTASTLKLNKQIAFPQCVWLTVWLCINCFLRKCGFNSVPSDLEVCSMTCNMPGTTAVRRGATNDEYSALF